ncbi:MAG: hypothetical protein GY855_00155 [candidate division Zixibacteria bacterium]|nr:hypothetical protein [candidate division Zixibacteria bacterium]
MSFVGIENRIKSGETEYLLKTSNDILENHIQNALFKDGVIVNRQIKTYPNDNGNLNINELVKNTHIEHKAYIEHLIGFSENLPESMDNALWRDRLGMGFYYLDMLDEAEREFKKAIEYNTEYSQAYNHLGRTMIRIGRYNAAIGYFEIASKQRPEYADYYIDLSEAYLKAGRCTNAFESASKALNINVYFAKAYYNQALALLLNSINREDFDLAKDFQIKMKENLTKSFSINPSLKVKEFDKALDYLDQERYKEAFDILRDTPSTNGTREYSEKKLKTYLKLASSSGNLTLDEIREYISYLEKKLIEFSNYADLHNELGAAYTIYARLINVRASDHYKKALEVNPSYKKAMKNLKITENDDRGTELLLRAVLGTKE